MKKLIICLLSLVVFFSCSDDEDFTLTEPSTVSFLTGETTLSLSEEFSRDTIITTTIQLVGQQESSAKTVQVSLEDGGTLQNDVHISIPSTVSIPPNSSTTTLDITIRGENIQPDDMLEGTVLISVDGSNNPNTQRFVITVSKLSCQHDLDLFLNQYTVTSTDPWGTYAPGGGAVIELREEDGQPEGRLFHDNFYGWTLAEGNPAVFFDLICGTNDISVPEQSYTTPGGYALTIVGGEGSTDPNTGALQVIFNVNNAADGDFMITEVFSPFVQSDCEVDLNSFLIPYDISSTDQWGTYSPGTASLVVSPDEENRLVHNNFYGWSEAEGNPAVYFDLICGTSNIVVPAQSYTTPGGYALSITGGQGTYNEQSGLIEVTFNVNNAGDGDFTITEVYTPQDCDLSTYFGPYSISSTDPWGTYVAGDGMVSFELDDNNPNVLIHKNFYGWSADEENPNVSFTVNCTTGAVTVLPQSYTTPGGYNITINGGTGQVDPESGNVTITFNVFNINDGDFEIVETFTK